MQAVLRAAAPPSAVLQWHRSKCPVLQPYKPATPAWRHLATCGTPSNTSGSRLGALQATGEVSTTDAAPSKGAVRAGRRVRQQNEAQPEILYTGQAVQAGRLPVVLSATFPDKFPTLSAARRVIRERCIHVDGTLGSCGLDVEAGQLLTRLQALKDTRRASKREVQLQVAYEDDHMAVVVKPWGVKCYGDSDDRTIVGALAGALQPSTQDDVLPRPQPVHRLDAAVGGLLACAKTKSAAKVLARAFEERRVQKKYAALLCGRLEPPSSGSSSHSRSDSRDGSSGGGGSSTSGSNGSSNGSTTSSSEPGYDFKHEQQPSDLTSSSGTTPSTAAPQAGSNNASAPSSQNNMLGTEVAAGPSGAGTQVHEVSLAIEDKPSTSYFRVLGHSRSPRYGGWVTQVELWPHTGRKHQLRVHMAALGTPICGDGLRALSSKEHISNQGLYLEAIGLTLEHPVTGQQLCVEVPEPPRFATLRMQQASAWNKVQQAMLWQQKKAAAAALALMAEPQGSALVTVAAVAAMAAPMAMAQVPAAEVHDHTG